MLEVKRAEPERDGIDLIFNDEPVCPYCKQKNETTDLKPIDEETKETECDNCGKTFVYTPNFRISYDTEPFENWYLDKRKSLINHKNKLESFASKSKWTEASIKALIQGIEELDKKAEMVLGEKL